MGKTKKSQRKLTSLSSGRLNSVTKHASSRMSSAATRTIIRKYHTTQKQIAKAIASNDIETATSLRKQLEADGGLERYQDASKLGQSRDRGGDSSKTLIEWVSQSSPQLKEHIARHRQGRPFRLLEVGALEADNACSRSGIFEVVRIDLNAQNRNISKQDFMDRPLPTSQNDRFDVISLSLVLNFVPSDTERGEMLKRVSNFFFTSDLSYEPKASGDGSADIFPCLFLVLPAPCVLNSRYFSDDKLTDIMQHLGYKLACKKISAKLAYYLWVYQPASRTISTNPVQPRSPLDRKTQVNPGHNRNNFAIIVKP